MPTLQLKLINFEEKFKKRRVLFEVSSPMHRLKHLKRTCFKLELNYAPLLISISSFIAKLERVKQLSVHKVTETVSSSALPWQVKSYLSKTPFTRQILKIYAVSRGLSRRTRKMRKKFWCPNLWQPIMIKQREA